MLRRGRPDREERGGRRLPTPLLLLLLSWGPGASAQAPACPAPESLTGGLEHPFAAVRYLADDALEGRLAGSDGERCAADFVAREFEGIGLLPGGTDGGYFQEVSLRSAVNPHVETTEGRGRNVVGLLPGADPRLRGEAVVVGAHHDHLGRGSFGSLARGEEVRTIHRGADDNASGVGALLAAAKLLQEEPRPARTVVFVTFTGEELGLLGSSHYVTHPRIPLERTAAMVNLDMVGRLGSDPLLVQGTGTAEEWDAILDSLEAVRGIPLARSPDGYGPSDHTSFYARDVPVLHFFTNVHSDYHRPTDRWEGIDREGLARVAGLVADVVRAVADAPELLTHVPGAGTPPDRARAGGYGAYLGTVPDFAPVEGGGVRLSAVSPGSPAEAAGLQAGDVLVRLGDHEVTDLHALTGALRELDPGTTVDAVLLRDGEERIFRVTLGERE